MRLHNNNAADYVQSSYQCAGRSYNMVIMLSTKLHFY